MFTRHGRIFYRFKIRVFRGSVHTENLDAQPFKVPCEHSENVERSRGKVSIKQSQPPTSNQTHFPQCSIDCKRNCMTNLSISFILVLLKLCRCLAQFIVSKIISLFLKSSHLFITQFPSTVHVLHWWRKHSTNIPSKGLISAVQFYKHFRSGEYFYSVLYFSKFSFQFCFGCLHSERIHSNWKCV